MKRETVVVLDFGGQYNQLVASRVRECNVYCEIYSYKTDLEKIKAMNPKGIILTGGPNSCYEADSPTCNKELFELGIPVLGLCYGAQLMMHVLGGKVEKADVSEYGKTEVLVDKTDSKIFKDVSDKTICWMSHTDYISQVAPGFEIAAHTCLLYTSRQGKIKDGQEINVVVPTGNFGNILAAYYAKQMGLPVHKLICASNDNKVLYDFFRTGTYDRKRDFILTTSPSMDILISSNLERLIYRIAGGDAKKCAELMQSLTAGGEYTITEDMKAQLADFYGNYCTCLLYTSRCV